MSRIAQTCSFDVGSTPIFRRAYLARVSAERGLLPHRSLSPAALSLALAAAFASTPLLLHANPTGGVAVHGTAAMVSNGNLLNVTTTNGAGTNNSVINWQSFSIPRGNSTNFQQPNSASTSINRVVTNNPSAIFGTLSSNGKLVVVNPAGITVGAGAVVDTAGFTAAAMRMSEDDAKAGRMRFNADGFTGSLSVQGNIIARGGDVVLIAPNAEVAKGAVVESLGGAVALVAGQQVEITGRGLEGILLQVKAPSDQAVNLGTLKGSAVGVFASTLKHSGLIQASGVGLEGGKVVLRATDVAEVTGRIEARRMLNAVEQGGAITVNAAIAVLAGELDARGTGAGSMGGTVAVQADAIIQSASVDASGGRAGGIVSLTASRSLIQTSDASVRADAADGAAGALYLRADSGLVLSSAQISANGAGDQGMGGNVQVLGASIQLQGASISADGDANGGTVLVGGDRQGQNPNLPNSRHLFINSASQLSANSRRRGNGGTVVLWSDGDTRLLGNVSARGAGEGGDGGFVEVSGKAGVQLRNLSGPDDKGPVDASAGPGGVAGTLLLDPKNITIVASTGGLAMVELVDPNPNASFGSGFGSVIEDLGNGQVLVADPTDSAGGSNAGAIYVFNKTTGALKSALTGSHANDRVGDGCNYVGNNGYCGYSSRSSTLVFQNTTWNGGVGAWTFFNPAAPSQPSGVVSASNSLVGTAVGDLNSAYFNTLDSGTAGLLIAPYYGGGRGAVANVDTVTGKVGTLSSANALVGSLPGDNVGSGYYDYLSSDQWLIRSPSWSSAAGALTLVNPAAIVPGVVSVDNSLVGGAAGDKVGEGAVYRFTTTGKLLVSSPNWGGGKGAFTVADTESFKGTVSATTSLVGNLSTDGASFTVGYCDSYSYCYSSAATYYNYDSLFIFNTSASSSGSLTRMHPGGAYTGPINAGNSLVGNAAGDFSGSRFDTWGSGAFSLLLPNWSSVTVPQAGALVLANAAAFPTGTVGSGNAIVGTSTGDFVSASLVKYGSSETLAYGKLVLVAPNYGGGTVNGTGAVSVLTLPDEASTTVTASGSLSSVNALVGGAPGDHVGSGGIDTSQRGYWMVRSPLWGSGGVGANAKGAVSFFEPAAPSSTLNKGVVSGSSNSWVGESAGDRIGFNTEFVMFSSATDNGLLLSRSWGAGKGAITPIADLAMPYGTISSGNSYVGTTASDGAGMTVKTFDNNGYQYSSQPKHAIVSNALWNGNRGALTYINEDFEALAAFGSICACNSLVGTTAGDKVGSGGITLLAPSTVANAPTVIVSSPLWSKNGTLASFGAYTFFNAQAGAARGALSTSDGRSIYGNNVGDLSGASLYTSASYNPMSVPAGKAVLVAPNYNAGKGGITLFDVTNPLAGASILSGSAVGDYVGNGGIYSVSGSQFLLRSPNFGGGVGALTYLDAANPPSSGVVSSANSLVGSSALDNLGGTNTLLGAVGSKTLVLNKSNAGSIYLMDTTAVAGRTGVLDGNKGLVGSTVGDFVNASFNNDYYSAGKVFITAPNWDNGGATNAGAALRLDASLSNAPTGTIGSGNALVGTSSVDRVGFSGVTQNAQGYYVRNDYWSNGTIANAGAITFFGLGAAMPTGAVSDANSLIGTAGNDLSGVYFADINAGNKLLLMAPNYGGGKGAVRLVDFAAGIKGTLDNTNALVGSTSGDRVGSNVSLTTLGGGFYALGSPTWRNGTGGITFFNSSGPSTGFLGEGNSMVGSAAGDGIGAYGTTLFTMAGGGVTMLSRSWGGGKGAITVLPSLANAKGLVDASNSLVGVTALDGAGFAFLGLDNNFNNQYASYQSTTRLVVSNGSFNGGRGMVSMIDASAAAPVGVISAANSLVGSTAGDNVGGIVQNFYGSGVVIRSPNWNGARGAVTFYSAGPFAIGEVSAANSLVGANANDRVGISGASTFSLGEGDTTYRGYYLDNYYFGNGSGALTVVPLAGAAGVVSAANSVLGLAQVGRPVILDTPALASSSGGYSSASVDVESEALRVVFSAGSGRVVYVDPRLPGNASYTGGLGFADSPGTDAAISAQTVAAMANAGTNVTLQANNDIVVNAAITTSNASASGQLKLEAGRNLLINANISLAGNGGLALIANSQFANAAYRDAGSAVLRTAAGVRLSNANGFVGALMDSGIGGTGAGGGSVELGDVQTAGLEIRNWSTASGAGIRQTAGGAWQSNVLRMETRAADGSIGTLNTPISFSASWLAARTKGGPVDLQSTASALNISDLIPVNASVTNGASSQSGNVGDGRTFDDFYGLSTSGVGSVALRAAGDLTVLGQNSAVSIAAQSLALQARSISLRALGAAVNVVARGALELRSSGDIAVEGGTAAGAFASVVSAKSALIVAGGRLGLKGGSAAGTYALVDPTDVGSGMTVNAASVNLQGGAGNGAYAALISQGGQLNLSAQSVTLAPGSGPDADAVIGAPNARTLLASFKGNDLGTAKPLGNGSTQGGYWTVNDSSSPQALAADLLTQQNANLLSSFISLWKKEKKQAQPDVVLGDVSCSAGG